MSFLIIPNMEYAGCDEANAHELETIQEEESLVESAATTTSSSSTTANKPLVPAVQRARHVDKNAKIVHMRAMFNYVPQDDLYIPCKELGLSFSKGDILHVVIGRDDADWWQAYKDDDKDQALAGLIPSQLFQEKYTLIPFNSFHQAR